jgi:hypothetical protein
MYIPINNFFTVYILLANKTRNSLFANNYLHIYIIYGDRAIIGFVSFAANLLTDQQMAPRSASETVRPKKSYFSSACEYVKLPFSLRVPKTYIKEIRIQLHKAGHNPEPDFILV